MRPSDLTFYATSIAILVFAIGLSLFSAADADLVPLVRHTLARHRSVVRDLAWQAGGIPVDLKLPRANANFVSFDVSFTPEAGAAYPNLLQTADGNAGLRIEANNGTISAVIADPSIKEGVFGVTLATDLAFGNAYRLQVSYTNRSRSKIAIESPDGSWRSFTFTAPSVNISDPKFGRGFNAERPWNGSAFLHRFSAAVTMSDSSAEAILGFAWSIGMAALVLLVLYVWPSAASRHWEAAFAGLDRFRAVPDLAAGEAGDFLSIFRLVAFLAVALGHGMLIFFRPAGLETTLISKPALTLLVGSPWAGVWMFFVLSGYLMGKGFWAFRYSVSLHGIAAYLNNRLVKIVPGYLAVILFFGLLYQPQILLPENAFILYRLATFNFLGDFQYRPIAALWSISTEFQFYVIAPVLTVLLLFLTRVHKSFIATFIILVLSGLSLRLGIFERYGFESWTFYMYTPLYANLDLFCFGILAASASRVLPHVERAKLTSWSGIALIALTYAVASALCARNAIFTPLNSPGNTFIWLGPTIIGVLSMLTVITVEFGYALGGSKMPATLARNVALLGALVYPLYLWHEPVFGALARVASGGGGLFAMAARILAALVTTFVLACFTYAFVELPAVRWRRSGRVRVI